MAESEAMTAARVRYRAAIKAKLQAEQEAEDAGWALQRELDKEEANGVRH